MKRHLALPALLLAAAFASGATAQVVGYNFRTGDVWVDSQLGYINDYGVRDRGYFVDDLVSSYGAPRYLVNELLDKRHWSAGDVYYATALAYATHRPLGDAVREFHALKGQMGKSKGRYESRGPGHSDKGDKGDKGYKGDKGDKGDKGYEGDKGGKGNGKGKGNSKGHGH